MSDISICLLENEIRVNVLGKFYNGLWFEKFGNIQKILLTVCEQKIVVDLSQCIYIAPTPFLSLLLTLKKSKAQNRCCIDIILPQNDDDDKVKFLNYCAREGFCDIINEITSCKYNVRKYNNFNVIVSNNFENVL